MRAALWGSLYHLLLTVVVALVAGHYLRGFQVSGPFLLMFPLFLWDFTVVLAWRGLPSDRGPHPVRADASEIELVEQTVKEFSFRPVSFDKRREGQVLKVCLTSADPRPIGVFPRRFSATVLNWDKMTDGGRRFALVHSLAPLHRSVLRMYTQSVAIQLGVLAALVASGLSSWVVFGLYCAAVLGITYFVRTGMFDIVVRWDRVALRMTRDLQAGIEFVQANPLPQALKQTSKDRVEELKRAAAQFGITDGIRKRGRRQGR